MFKSEKCLALRLAELGRPCNGRRGQWEPAVPARGPRGEAVGSGAACLAPGREARAACRVPGVPGARVPVGSAVARRAQRGLGCGRQPSPRPFPFCPQTCNASFATRDRLRSHLACHEDKVPCQVCGKYLRAAYMADHLKKHSEGPSSFCSICNRGNRPAVRSRRGAGLRPASGPALHGHPSCHPTGR